MVTSMAKFEVSLNVVSLSLALSELANRLGRPPSSGSHSKGDPRGSGQFASTVWKLCSSLSDGAAIQEHIKDIARQFPPQSFIQCVPEGCRVYIDIGLFFDSWNSVVTISHEMLAFINAYKAEIELTCYPG